MNPLHEDFEYRDGALYWKTGKRKGKRFGSLRKTNLHREGSYKNTKSNEHRLIWQYFNNKKPTYEIEHIDGNPQNNLITNLKEVTRLQIVLKRKKPKNNTSGHKGVCWNKRDSNYRVRVGSNGEYVEKYTKDFELACLMADELRNQLHGNYAKH